MSSETPTPARHIRLTSHPVEAVAHGAPPIRWGDADPLLRGPIVGTTTNRNQRNVIGTHSGSYGIYRALAVAAKSLTRGHRADLTNTSPTDSVGPYPQWAQGDRIDRAGVHVPSRLTHCEHRDHEAFKAGRAKGGPSKPARGRRKRGEPKCSK